MKIQNTKVDKRIIDVVDFFKKKGYKSCILKGQAAEICEWNHVDNEDCLRHGRRTIVSESK